MVEHRLSDNEKAPLILIVEDTTKDVQLLGNILKKNGYRTADANDGRQATQMIRNLLPDLVLLDVLLPGLNGFEVCGQIRNEFKTKDIPIIFVTVKDNEDDIVQAFDAGAVDYVTKPYNTAELLARVRTHIELKRKRDLIVQYNLELENEIAERKKIEREKEIIVAELDRKNEILKNMIALDDLTGLYNRKHMMERLSQEIAEGRRYSQDLSVILFDVDHFKQIKYTFGQPFADEILIKTAATIKNYLREIDLVGRYSEAEFLVVLPHTHHHGAYISAERIRKQIHDLKWRQKGLRITVSAGISTMINVESEEVNIKSDKLLYKLIMKAGNLLYKAKQNGRDRIEMETDDNRPNNAEK